MASRADAEAGWELFREADFLLTREEVNSELAAFDHAPISARTYQHYRKLHRYGYESYIPINQLDVRTMEDPVWDRAARSRYVSFLAQEPVRVRAIVQGEFREIDGNARELSEGEGLLQVDGRSAIDVLELLKSGQWMVEVVFESSGEIQLAEVSKVSVDRRRRRGTLRVSFLQPASVAELLGRDPLPFSQVSIQVGEHATEVLLSKTARDVYWLYQAVDGVRLAADEILQALDKDQDRSIDAPSITHLRVESPLLALIDAAWPVVGGLVLLAGGVLGVRKKYWDGGKSKAEKGKTEAETEKLVEETRRLRWEQDQREEYAKHVDLDGVVRLLEARIADEIGVEPDSGETARDRARSVLRSQALPALAQLAESSDGDLAVEGEDEDDQLRT